MIVLHVPHLVIISALLRPRVAFDLVEVIVGGRYKVPPATAHAPPFVSTGFP
jgi:hypothetical protein